MTSPSAGSVSRQAASTERVSALSLVLTDLSDAAQQAEALVATQPVDTWAGLLVVGSPLGSLLGAVWLQEIGGGAAMLWPPRLNAQVEPGLADALTTAALALAAQREVKLVQALLAGDADADTQLLERHGFRRLADLAYLACRIERQALPKFDSPLAFRSCDTLEPGRLEAMVSATYIDTLDLPELNDWRRADEVLAEYRAAPQYDPRLWFIVTSEQRDVGCLLLNDQPSLDQVELVYFGLAPEARGHRWGREVVRFAQHQARQLGRRQLVLAVSADNRTALDTYAATGFFAWQIRRTLVRYLRDPGSAGANKS